MFFFRYCQAGNYSIVEKSGRNFHWKKLSVNLSLREIFPSVYTTWRHCLEQKIHAVLLVVHLMRKKQRVIIRNLKIRCTKIIRRPCSSIGKYFHAQQFYSLRGYSAAATACLQRGDGSCCTQNYATVTIMYGCNACTEQPERRRRQSEARRRRKAQQHFTNSYPTTRSSAARRRLPTTRCRR